MRKAILLVGLLAVVGCAQQPRADSVRTKTGDIILADFAHQERKAELERQSKVFDEKLARTHSSSPANNVFPGILPRGWHGDYLGNGLWTIGPGI